MPSAINLKLARDINSIGLYYEELKQSLGGKKATTVKKTVTIKQFFRKGHKVSVVPHKPKDIMRDNALIDWEEEMDTYLGKSFTIESIRANGVNEAYTLNGAKDSKGNHFLFAKEWLTFLK